jgi:D-aspartate ligase
MKQNNLPLAVVLSLSHSGYGIVRSLSAQKIPIIAFTKNLNIPECQTGLLQSLFHFQSKTDLLAQLIELGQRHEQPVLFLTADVWVTFFCQHRNQLEQLYKIHCPDNAKTKLLLHKTRFYPYCIEKSYPAPLSAVIESPSDIDALKDEISTPLVMKPFDKNEAWQAADLPKAYLIRNFSELNTRFQTLSKIEQRFLVQEYIEGGDDHIFYSLFYFDENSQPLCHFEGQKIRQWPVQLGSTASTARVKNKEDQESIWNLTLKIFTELKYIGFGSIEYKKDARTGQFYIMEPTVCRTNLQTYVATANGINIPLMMYQDLAGVDFGYQPKLTEKSYTYVDEYTDLCAIRSLRKHQGQSIKAALQQSKGAKKYRFYSSKDPKVFLSFCKKLMTRIVKKLWRTLIRQSNSPRSKDILSK